MPTADARLAVAKAALRERMKTWLAAVTAAERAAGGDAVAAAVFASLDAGPDDGPVALFASLPTELPMAPLDELLREAGYERAFPRICDDELVFHLAPPELPGASMPLGAFRVPTPEPSWPTVALADCSLVIVPGLAFDEQGRRLGWGRGYYDRALFGLKPGAPRVVGVALDVQALGEVPAGAQDVRLPAVCTPALGVSRTIW